MPTSTLTQYFSDGMYYLWDSFAGFFYTANGKEFTIVVLILTCVIALIIGGIKGLFRKWK